MVIQPGITSLILSTTIGTPLLLVNVTVHWAMLAPKPPSDAAVARNVGETDLAILIAWVAGGIVVGAPKPLYLYEPPLNPVAQGLAICEVLLHNTSQVN